MVTLVEKGKIWQNIEKSQILWRWLGIKFYFGFYFFLTNQFCKNSNIYIRIFFLFLKSVSKQTWSYFNTKFELHCKDRKSSYQAMEVLRLFCDLSVLILGKNIVKGLRVIRNVKAIKHKGVWGELESRKRFQRQ